MKKEITALQEVEQMEAESHQWAKDFCVVCKVRISKGDYNQKGNYCHSCNARCAERGAGAALHNANPNTIEEALGL